MTDYVILILSLGFIGCMLYLLLVMSNMIAVVKDLTDKLMAKNTTEYLQIREKPTDEGVTSEVVSEYTDITSIRDIPNARESN